MATGYTEEVMDHFRNPRNVGEIPDADGIGEVGNPVCGDMMSFYIKVKDNRLTDVKFKTFGCGAAIAVSSMTSEMAKGKTIEEAMKITRQTIAEKLGGLPPQKMHCSNLGADALHKAIENYLNKGKPVKEAQAIVKHAAEEEGHAEECACPYCSSPVDKKSAFCKPCGKNFVNCPKCGMLLAENVSQCPECHTEIKH
jgi:nitrogen fixation NifU-like protein